jgi:hypothetical protein
MAAAVRGRLVAPLRSSRNPHPPLFVPIGRSVRAAARAPTRNRVSQWLPCRLSPSSRPWPWRRRRSFARARRVGADNSRGLPQRRQTSLRGAGGTRPPRRGGRGAVRRAALAAPAGGPAPSVRRRSASTAAAPQLGFVSRPARTPIAPVTPGANARSCCAAVARRRGPAASAGPAVARGCCLG